MFRRSLILAFIIVLLFIAPWALDRAVRTEWVGSTDLTIDFVVMDSASGQPIEGAEIASWPEYNAQKQGEVTQILLRTNQDGVAECVCHDCMCFGTRSALGFTDSYFVHPPDCLISVSAPQYLPSEPEVLDAPARGREVQRIREGGAKLVVRVSLERAHATE